MPFFLFPREMKFFDLLEQQAQAVVDGADLFYQLVSGWKQDHPNLTKLRDLEHECDITTHEILDKLNRTFVTPIDREDIHVLATELDDVVDIIEGITERMHLFGIDNTHQDLHELARILQETTMYVLKAIKGLRDLKHTRRTLDYCIEINRLENRGDRASEQAIARLFLEEKNAIEVIKWKEIYDMTEAAIDKCEDIASLVEGIVVKYG